MPIDNLTDLIKEINSLSKTEKRQFFNAWGNQANDAFEKTQAEIDAETAAYQNKLLIFLNNALGTSWDGSETAGDAKIYFSNLIESKRNNLQQFVGDNARIDAWKLKLADELSGADIWQVYAKMAKIIRDYKNAMN